MFNPEYETVPCDAQGRFYNDHGCISSIPSSIVGANPKIDPAAVFSLLRFGAIIPPLSPWKGVYRFIPGYKYRGSRIVGSVELPKQCNISTLNLEQQSEKVENLLDDFLVKHIENKDPVLLFSGGVDSGIIASRLAVLGFRNSLLVNYSFGDDDLETKLAERIAKKIGLKFERVIGREHLCACLDKPGKVYPQPFGDHSTAPASELAVSVVKYLAGKKSIIIDGTGADGAFGMTSKVEGWKQVYQIPEYARKLALIAYNRMFWYRNCRIENITRILGRSATMPILSAVLAQNSLAGTFYNNSYAYSTDNQLKAWIEKWAGEDLSAQIVAADLALTCANIFAQKAKPILEAAGHKVIFPFLDSTIVSTVLASIPHWKMDEPKSPLKRSLSRHISKDMVYRPKSGFIDYKGEIFYCEEFIDHLRNACEPTSPIANILKQKPLLNVCKLLKQRKFLPAQTFNFIWSVVFTDRWYRTALKN